MKKHLQQLGGLKLGFNESPNGGGNPVGFFHPGRLVSVPLPYAVTFISALEHLVGYIIYNKCAKLYVYINIYIYGVYIYI